MNSKLVEDNMNLVYYLVNRYFPTFLHNEDVIQNGMVGLCNAADTWDENKSTFSSYASHCILNEIKHRFRDEKKHNGHLSLDYEYKTDEGGNTLSDMIVGDSDQEYLGTVNIDLFQGTCTDKEQKIMGMLKAGMKQPEIAKKLGVSQQYVNSITRTLKIKWGGYNEY